MASDRTTRQTRRVVPSLATRWSHAPGRNSAQVVPCSWQATHNLGTAKRERRRARWEAQVRTEIFTAVHGVVDKATTVVAEDLTKTLRRAQDAGKNINRRLAAWTKGVTAEALTNVSERRGSALVHVNAAYTHKPVTAAAPSAAAAGPTSLHPVRGGVAGRRHAAINILHRAGDPDIALHTPHHAGEADRAGTDRSPPDQTAGPGLQPATGGGERIIRIAQL